MMKWLAVVVCGLLLAQCQAREEEDGRLVAAYSTRSIITMTTITSTRPYTCANYYGTNVCQKRRYRRYKTLVENFDDSADDGLLGIDSSFDTSLDDMAVKDDMALKDDMAVKDEGRDGRIALTVWSTTSSTYTITSTSVNTSTTYSLSYYCTVVSASLPPACTG